MTIEGFTTTSAEVAPGVRLGYDEAGHGDPIVLLHGFPQTRLMWRHVARDLAVDHRVVCPDLRGYGDSDKPAATTADVYSKRTMGADIVALADRLGLGRFALVGHDRGTLVAFRAALDHPERISHLVLLDAFPTLDTWDVLHGVDAAVAWHLYLMAQPQGLPEAMIAATADAFFGHFLDVWTKDPSAIPGDVRAHYLRAAAGAVESIVADYRATATIDIEQDRASLEAGDRLRMPVAVVQQDWGGALGFDAAALWRRWAPEVRHVTTSAGHFMAEEAPAEIVDVIRDLLRRPR